MTVVKTTAELHAAIEAGTDPKTIQVAAAEPVDTDKLKAEASEAAAKAERERCQGIHALAAPGFEKEIAQAIEDGSSVEATGLALFKAAQDRGITLAGMQADGTSAPPATPPKEDKEAQEHEAAVSAITGRWKASA